MLLLAESDVTLVQGLPASVHLGLTAAFLGGLVLWAAGAKVVKPIFSLLGVLVGGFVGLIVAGALGLGSFGGVGGWLITTLIGGIICLVVTLSIVKMAIVFTAAATFCLVGFGGGLVYVQLTGGPESEVAPPADDNERDSSGGLLFNDPRTDSLVPISKLFDDGTNETIEKVEEARVVAMRVQAIVRSGFDLIHRHWTALGTDQKAAVAGSTLGGLALGLAAGFFFPKRSTAVITALAGSASFLISGAALIEGLPWLESARPAVEGKSPIFWAIVWSVTATVGLLVQLNLISKKKSKKKDKDDDED
ncbi:MAG: hypothetical protein AAGI53_01915 [Planctomycetota bacterium]